jgi:YaiO family outer membrane protein
MLLALAVIPGAIALAAERDIRSEVDTAIAQADYDYALSLINEQLAIDDDDSGMHFRKAQVLARQGKPDAALLEYEALQARYPNDVDYVFGRAQVLLQQGESELALGELRRASELAPDYEDVWRQYYRALSEQSPDASDSEMWHLKEHAALHFPDAEWWRAVPDRQSPVWTLQGGGSVERLSNGLAGWNSQFAEIAYSGMKDQRYFGRGSRDERFGRADTQVSAGADWQLPDNWYAGVSISLAASADFLPRSQYDLHAGRRVAKGWLVGLGFRRRAYANDTVHTWNGNVEHYFGDFRAAWTLSVSSLNGASDSVGHALSLNWYANEATSLGASINFGEEAEAVSPGQVLRTRVRGATLTIRQRLGVRVSLDGWLGLHEQGDLYRRQYAGLAVSVGL